MAYPEVSPMATVSSSEFYTTIEKLRELIEARHRSIRDDLENRFDRLDVALEDHKAEDRKIADLVLRIMTQREEEQKQAVKTSTWVALLVSGGLTVVWQMIAKAFK